MRQPITRTRPADGPSLVMSLLDLAEHGDLDLTDLDTADVRALAAVLARILAGREP